MNSMTELAVTNEMITKITINQENTPITIPGTTSYIRNYGVKMVAQNVAKIHIASE